MTALEQIGHLADIPMQVEIELDRTVMTVREILALGPGRVIRSGRAAGENIGILIGGAPVASGEVVIIEETVGVRITDFKEDS